MSEQGYAYKDITIPDFVVKRLQVLSQRTGKPFEQLAEHYYRIYKDPWLHQDPQFKSDYDRHTYAIRLLWARMMSKPPTREVYVIPFGLTDARQTKSGLMSRVYVMYRLPEEKQWHKGVVILTDAQAALWETVQLFSVYKIRVSAGSTASNILWSTPDTNFDELVKTLNVDPIEFLEKSVGVKRFRLAEVHKNLSRRVGRFVDELDLKGLDAFVLRFRTGQRKDGSKFGLYVVSDDSVGAEDELDEEGRLIPAQFTVWVPYIFVKYDVDSEIYVYGQVTVDSEGRPFMNAIGVIPVHAKPIA